VRSDNYTGAYEAIKYLVNLGHKKILLIMADLHYLDHKDRYEGAVKAIEESGLEQNEHNILNSYLFNNTDLQYKLDFIFKSSCPDAIFVGGDQEALRVIKVLKDMGLNVPGGVSVMGYDNLEIAVNYNPPLTTVNQPIYEIGKEAAKLLLTMINNKDYSETKVLLKNNSLMIRESVKQRI
jgi:LacI family transcriptional regulator